MTHLESPFQENLTVLYIQVTLSKFVHDVSACMTCFSR